MFEKKTNRKIQWEENWVTSAGAWIPGERVVMHGLNLMESMRGNSWMEMMLLSITGKKADKQTAKLLDEALVYIGCFPDPRLWNNRVAALAATGRSSSTLALSAAAAVSEAVVYGFQPAVAALQMFRKMSEELNDGKDLKELLFARLEESRKSLSGKPGRGKERQVASLPGYGRPLKKKDERITPLLDTFRRHNYSRGKSVNLAFEIENTLENAGLDFRLNAAGLVAALAHDLNILDQEFLHYVYFWFFPGFVACYDDAIKHPEGSFFPVRCEQIDYKGVVARQWQTQ